MFAGQRPLEYRVGWRFPRQLPRVHRLALLAKLSLDQYPPQPVIRDSAVSVPCGFSPKRMPIGLQTVGNDLREALLLRITATLQNATQFHTREPKVVIGEYARTVTEKTFEVEKPLANTVMSRLLNRHS